MRCHPAPVVLAIAALFAMAAPLHADTISGECRTGDNTGIRNVTVTLKPDNGLGPEASWLTVKTDENGAFHFDNVPDGHWQLEINKSRWESVAASMSLPLGDLTRHGRAIVDITRTDSGLHLRVQMELTPLWQALAAVQLSGLIYALLFMILVLVLNFFAAPRPSPGMAVGVEVVIIFLSGIALIRLRLFESVPLIVGALSVTTLVHLAGVRAARARVAERDQEEAEALAGREETRRWRESLVGRHGVALSDLKLVGRVQLGDDIVEVRSRTSLIERDTPVVVVGIEGPVPIVIPRAEAAAAGATGAES